MGIQGMKVHHSARGLWDHDSPSLSLGCKRFRPLAPKAPADAPAAATFDLKSFIRPECGLTKTVSSDFHKKESAQVEAGQAGGTRWNPTQEQIGILEMLYRSGIRTPNAHQIEQITGQLSKYGKIEGKNVFYWFQNHKARERQKQKRDSLGLSHCPRTAPSTVTSLFLKENNPCKRKCMSWGYDHQCLQQDTVEQNKTLQLFPLHPEGK